VQVIWEIELRWNTVFCSWKSWICILKDKFWWRFPWESRARKLCTVWENFLSRHRSKCLRFASAKFVLACESNLPLATGLASRKVSLQQNSKSISRMLGTTSGFNFPIINSLGSLSKQRRRRQRGRQKIKGLMSKTIGVHVRYKSLYISLASSAKHQREMTNFCAFYGTWTTTANFSHFHLELYAIVAYSVWASF